MAYKVIDEKGIGYSHEGGTTIIPKGGIIEDKLIDGPGGEFRQAAIDGMVRSGRIEPINKSSTKVISPDNMKMPEVSKKAIEPKPKTKKAKGK